MKHQPAPIPNGFLVGDLWVRQAEIRQLNGYDEQLLAKIHGYFSPVKTTLLLERVTSFGELTQKLDLHLTIRRLTVGDRLALILQLRKVTLGDIMHSVLQCPKCKEQLSFDMSVDSLLQPATQNPQTEYALNLEGVSLTVRPITGFDLEAVDSNPDLGNLKEQLLRGCIVASKPALPVTLSSQLQESISLKLAEIDPQAEIVLSVQCPACNGVFQVPFDVEDYFYREITARYRQLEREVHWIAFHYHWSEKAILYLSMGKRKHYIDMINTTLSGEGF